MKSVFVLICVMMVGANAACSDSETVGPSVPPAADTQTDEVTELTDIHAQDATAVDSLVEDGGAEDATPTDIADFDAVKPDVAPLADAHGLEPISFAKVFDEILVPKGCTGGYCHAGHAGGLLMDTMETAYENLINQAVSTETPCQATVRVVPGEPASSMLWVRVAPDAEDCLTEPQKMPPFDDKGLSGDELQLIHDWILTGANP